MEQKQKFQLKFNTYKKAVTGLSKSLDIDTSQYDEVVGDAIKNGRIQKFEYCTELTWKLIKKYLYIYHNIDTKSPSLSIKEFFNIDMIEHEVYEKLLRMLEMRNRLSHEYREEYFVEIHNQLGDFLNLMEYVIEIISRDINT
jgi:nucleotidyltransferase substrate binding protein (TIGR01987 family)